MTTEKGWNRTLRGAELEEFNAWIRRKERRAALGKDYLASLPSEIPPGMALVHNHVRPTRQLATGPRGFRCWLEIPNDYITECNCGFAPELGTHYRIAVLGKS